MNDLVKLAIDVYHNSVGEFSKTDAEEALRNALIDINGGSTKLDYKALRKNGAAIFEAMEEILQILLVEGIEQQFGSFVDVRNLAFGDKNYFMVEDYNLFPVATISGGNGNMRRQRLVRQAFTVDTAWKGVKIYDELERFLAGRVDWALMINKVQRSFQAQMAGDIYNSIVTGYSALTAPYTVSGAYDRTNFNTLVQHVEAITQREATVYGTKLALQAAAPAFSFLPTSNEQANQDGFFRVVDGIRFVEIKQAIAPGTDNFAIGDKFLLVVPNGEEKIVKMVLEGDPIIKESMTGSMTNMDDSVEYEIRKKYGVATITSTKFGVYLLA